jgi:hypothetical protein
MKPVLIVALLLAILAPAHAQEIAVPKDLDPAGLDLLFIEELKMWRAFQSHDLLAFGSYLLPDFIEVEKAIQTREQVMANINACTLVSFKLTNHQIRMLGPDAAVLAYNGSSHMMCGEAQLSGNFNATTTWVRRNGKWFIQMHTEIPVKL